MSGRAVIFVLVVLCVSPPARAQFLHPKIKSKETTIRKVVVLPAKGNVVRDSMKGPEGMAAESDDLSARVETMLTEVLLKQKHVKTVPTTAPSADGDPQQKYNVADFRSEEHTS